VLGNHPESQYIFRASAIEDKIRTELLAMQSATGSAELIGRQETVVLVLIPQLIELNKNHFNHSAKIENTILQLRDAVNKLDHTQAWECFLNLAERCGDNFGTWAI
jgi:hypothetical protein